MQLLGRAGTDVFIVPLAYGHPRQLLGRDDTFVVRLLTTDVTLAYGL